MSTSPSSSPIPILPMASAPPQLSQTQPTPPSQLESKATGYQRRSQARPEAPEGQQQLCCSASPEGTGPKCLLRLVNQMGRRLSKKRLQACCLSPLPVVRALDSPTERPRRSRLVTAGIASRHHVPASSGLCRQGFGTHASTQASGQVMCWTSHPAEGNSHTPALPPPRR